MNIPMREHLAEYAHKAWSKWMFYLFSQSSGRDDGTMVIPKWAVDRWSRQMNTEYKDLSAEDKESDRIEAIKMMEITNNGWCAPASQNAELKRLLRYLFHYRFALGNKMHDVMDERGEHEICKQIHDLLEE
jgi:hypothetical protein